MRSAHSTHKTRSPDSTRLAGHRDDERGNGIVIYTFTSRTDQRLTDFGEWPVWLPDGRRVLFVSGGREFWVVDTRTKGDAETTPGAAGGRHRD